MYNKYLIKEGERIDYLANKFNTTIDKLMEINNMYDYRMFTSGREINVPSNSDYFTTYTVNSGDTFFMGDNFICVSFT